MKAFKLVVFALLMTIFCACTENSGSDESGHSDVSIELLDQQPVDPIVTRELEQALLNSMQSLSAQQSEGNEKMQTQELKQLSEVDRESLQALAAAKLMQESEAKALKQAQDEAAQRGPIEP